MLYALGLIETRGLIGAIEAADAMVKAADVKLIGKEKTNPALITVKVVGEVSAVKAAVDAGAAAAKRIGELVAQHIIPKPDDQMISLYPELLISDREVASVPVPVSEPEAPAKKTRKRKSSPQEITPEVPVENNSVEHIPVQIEDVQPAPVTEQIDSAPETVLSAPEPAPEVTEPDSEPQPEKKPERKQRVPKASKIDEAYVHGDLFGFLNAVADENLQSEPDEVVSEAKPTETVILEPVTPEPVETYDELPESESHERTLVPEEELTEPAPESEIVIEQGGLQIDEVGEESVEDTSSMMDTLLNDEPTEPAPEVDTEGLLPDVEDIPESDEAEHDQQEDIDISSITMGLLENKNVAELRRLARAYPDFPIAGRQISRANRHELLTYFNILLT